MKTLLALLLASVCGAVAAETPATNPMPDGSRDLYLGLGAVSAPLYAGARARDVKAMPLLQMEWSNGVFVSGLSAGMHLSHEPAIEFGPLLAIHPGRDNDGSGGIGAVTEPAPGGSVRINIRGQNAEANLPGVGMAGVDNVPARLQAGAFFNYYFSPALRLTNSLLYGAGREHDGLAWTVGLQQTAIALAQQHRVTFGATVTMVNRAHNASFFGVTRDQAFTSGFAAYAPGSGLRDVSLSAGWNWALSPDWMLASGVRVSRLQGDARRSPLVERPTNVSVSTGLAYRF